MLSVLVIGNSIVDTLLQTSSIPIDDKVYASSKQIYAGGQGANATQAMALLGLKVFYAGRVGDDSEGEFALKSLQAVGVDCTPSLVVKQVLTPTATVIVDTTHHQRTIIMYQDDRIDAIKFKDLDRYLRQVDLLYLDGFQIDEAMVAAQQARALGLPVVSDMEVFDAKRAQLLPWVTHLVAPERVIREIVPEASNLSEALSALSQRPTLTAVVATCGADGSYGIEADQPLVHIPAMACQVKDSTGAGDAYHAGFVAGLLHGKTLSECMQLATQVAAIKCAIEGPRIRENVAYLLES